MLAHELLGVVGAHAAIPDAVRIHRDRRALAAAAHARGARDADVVAAAGVLDPPTQLLDERDGAPLGAVGVAAHEHVLAYRLVRVAMRHRLRVREAVAHAPQERLEPADLLLEARQRDAVLAGVALERALACEGVADAL